MKKFAAIFGLLFSATLFILKASAIGSSPITGEPRSIVPFIFAIVALILVIAFAWLTYLTKKKK